MLIDSVESPGNRSKTSTFPVEQGRATQTYMPISPIPRIGVYELRERLEVGLGQILPRLKAQKT